MTKQYIAGKQRLCLCQEIVNEWITDDDIGLTGKADRVIMMVENAVAKVPIVPSADSEPKFPPMTRADFDAVMAMEIKLESIRVRKEGMIANNLTAAQKYSEFDFMPLDTELKELLKEVQK